MQLISRPIELQKPVVFERDGEVWTTSLDVARVFEKEHDEVLRKIRSLECSKEFSLRNFSESEWTNDRGQTYPMFELTQDGFSFLAMGFTGRKAAQFKEWYVAEFNRMRKTLTVSRDLVQELLIHRKQTDDRLIELLENSSKLLENHSVGLGVLDNRVGQVESKVDEISQELSGIKSCLPLVRRKLSKDTIAKHIECIFRDYHGKCPCCTQVQIIGYNGIRLSECTDDHFINRHENSLDKTWLICKRCNSDRSSGKSDHQQVLAFFNAYQARLKVSMNKNGLQLSMAQILAMKRR